MALLRHQLDSLEDLFWDQMKDIYDAEQRITEALEFMQACGVTDLTTPEINRTTLYTSHEALLLGFEQAMTRVDSTSGLWYDTSAHLLWVGERTRDPAGAHVDFCRGISNRLPLCTSDSPRCSRSTGTRSRRRSSTASLV